MLFQLYIESQKRLPLLGKQFDLKVDESSLNLIKKNYFINVNTKAKKTQKH